MVDLWLTAVCLVNFWLPNQTRNSVGAYGFVVKLTRGYLTGG